MKVSQLAKTLELRSVWDGWSDRDVTGAYTSDLLSDVVAHADESQVLITIQAHKNTVAVAVLKELSAMIITGNRPIEDDMTEAAQSEDLPLFVTADDQYTVSWKTHEALKG